MDPQNKQFLGYIQSNYSEWKESHFYSLLFRQVAVTIHTKNPWNTRAFSFPLQCWDVIVKLRGCNNIAKGKEKTKESRILQSVSMFLSAIVACTIPKVISTSLKISLMSRIDNCSSAIKIPQKPSNHLPSGKWRTEFPSLIAKSTSPVLSDTIFFAHCYFTVQPINCNKYLFYHASF